MLLPGALYRQIAEALIDAFDTDSFARMLRSYLSVRLDTITTEKTSFTAIVHDTLNWAQREDRIADLVAGAKKANPHNKQLQSLPDTFVDSAFSPAPAKGLSRPIETPADFVTASTRLFLPLIRTESRQVEWLDSAFTNTQNEVLLDIGPRGTPREFMAHCLSVLLLHDFDLLESLFAAARSQLGHDGQAQIPILLTQAQALAGVRTRASTDTPTDVYVIYAHREAASRDAYEQISQFLTRVGWRNVTSSDIEREDVWREHATSGLSAARAVIVVLSPRLVHDQRAQVEMLAARDKQKPIVAIQLGDNIWPPALPTTVATIVATPFTSATLDAIAAQLPERRARATVSPVALTPYLLQRAAELIYMDRLKLAQLRHVAQYTRLGGESIIQAQRSRRMGLNPVVAKHEFEHMPWREAMHVPAERRAFTDAIGELQAIGRAVLLGDPGAGKTTTLYKLAADQIDAALVDRNAPIPLMVRMGQWTDAQESCLAFLQRSVGALGAGLEARLDQKRAVLLLDGINEIPARQQADKFRAVKRFLARYPDLPVIVTCREHDYPVTRDLALDRVTVAPLDAVRIHTFANNYLDPDYGAGSGTDLFWQLAGAPARETFERFTAAVGDAVSDPFAAFWLATDPPEKGAWGWHKADSYFWDRWVKERANPASLLVLATNPYMLFMLVDVYQSRNRSLPANRGELFDQFVTILLRREQLDGAVGVQLLQALADVAAAMQQMRVDLSDGAMTALALTELDEWLTPQQRYQAASANLLTIGDDARFAHQLLQEYFVARMMRQRIFERRGPDPLAARAIWPEDNWWQPKNWEEATILLAGLDSDDCTRVLEWVADANPELAARCIVESGAHTPEETKIRLRERWLPRLTDMRGDPDARARAAVGRALGRVTLHDGTLLDNRPGVDHTRHWGVKLPDIAWGKVVRAGRYQIGGDAEAYNSFEAQRVPIDRPYQLAQYPVTIAQFACFVQAADGDDARWWTGMPEEWKYKAGIRDSYWTEGNRPRETVTWYQAVAFCRWLDHHYRAAGWIEPGAEIMLPHEYEWEVAARYAGDGQVDRRVYPWGGDEISAEYANYGDTNIGQTSAVGIFPAGHQPELNVYDLSGNVWEWCRNKYDDPQDEQVDQSNDTRTLRGGSWVVGSSFARVTFRDPFLPPFRNGDLGFRCLVRRPPSHLDP